MKTKEQIEIEALNKIFLENWIKGAKIGGVGYFNLQVPKDELHKIEDISQIEYNTEIANCRSRTGSLAFNLLMVSMQTPERFKEFILDGLNSDEHEKIAITLMDTCEKLNTLSYERLMKQSSN